MTHTPCRNCNISYDAHAEERITFCHLHAAAPIMKGQLQTGIDAMEAAIHLFLSKEDSEAFAALKGIIAGNEMALAKAEGTPDAG